ncbi:hypothetical protein PHLGIDRAFT_113867 [Phlebiopsis gigantea 11061_1 CR5-6]|uniref:Uncharacterized protein n=1 Tax=Phlebiopsis gigantea (strain 11061_1 CR5-6) TaxID=745531 RepID=A0A0C3SE44_PHLG1|nr:hypothetical protein PHLGIDRAFT_113867 [Phlebiopsis gigantea 11061_1 CR5-6]
MTLHHFSTLPSPLNCPVGKLLSMQYYATPIHMLAPEAPPFIPFSSLKDRPDLISLEDARQNPSIVYGSFERLSRQTPVSTGSPRSPSLSPSSHSGSATAFCNTPSPSCREQFGGGFDLSPIKATSNRHDTTHQEQYEMRPINRPRTRQGYTVRGNWL